MLSSNLYIWSYLIMHTKKIFIRYFAEMSVAFLFYFVVLVAVHRYGFPMPKGTLKTLVLVSPMIPVLLTIWVIMRGIRRLDEYGRLQVLETIAITFGITAGCTFTYGFLENAGYPRLSMFMVWTFMGSVWAVVAILRLIADR